MPNETNDSTPVAPVEAWGITESGRLLPDSVRDRRATAIDWAETEKGCSWVTCRREYEMRVVRVTVSVEGEDDA
jgi:hypothetical protein